MKQKVPGQKPITRYMEEKTITKVYLFQELFAFVLCYWHQ